ncbi:histone-like nucleoid-structuring protein Lsr2 [Microbacterium sp. No. 7]|uniref:histone-like nucleoid-structuring protein Lsr2 n=1 Tax=Microbacterium sp. No. 7 TaxID=1714373 RepID=UPI0006CFE215|nr:Lsr2 family protein [Microbacterium sp. No. 7]ALJ21644.1 hypothetical protein AOA12_17795 [Microbacterium sp. No. 7]
MAKKQIIQLVDDLDGTVLENGEGVTIRFALEGRTYEIDLSDANAEKLRAAFAPYVAAGRSVTAARTEVARPRRTASKSSELAAIRAWASDNGFAVSSRGRIPANVIAAYEAAH